MTLCKQEETIYKPIWIKSISFINQTWTSSLALTSVYSVRLAVELLVVWYTSWSM